MYRLLEKERNNPNKFAQANAKSIDEFLEFSKMCYFKALALQKEVRVLQCLHTEAVSEVLRTETKDEEQAIKDMWAKFSSNEEIKAGLKSWADLVIEERKINK